MSETNIIKQRLDILRKKLLEKQLDSVLVLKRENILYLSGFSGTFGALFITNNEACLITDSRYLEQASKQAELFLLVPYKVSIADTLNEVLMNIEIKNIGFEENYITYENFNAFNKNLSVKNLKPLEGLIESMRVIKTEDEIESIKKAVEIADDAFTHILKFLKPGIIEYEVAAEIEYFMKKAGAKGPSFDTIVASGERSSMPHGVAADRKLKLGDAVIMDYGAIFDEYCSDMTRTVFIGEPLEELKKVYNIVLDAQLLAIENALEGKLCKDIDLCAREHITKMGYGDKFGHSLGHGVGLEIHEEPRFSSSEMYNAMNGMVVTVEPGVYLEGVGGVRIEDIIIIAGNKPEVLTKSTKKMIII